MRIKLYFIATITFSILMVGSAGALYIDALTFFEGCWQSSVFLIASAWFWNLLRIESERTAKSVHRTKRESEDILTAFRDGYKNTETFKRVYYGEGSFFVESERLR